MSLVRLHTFRRQLGFTLIELMIAVTIGLLLTVVVAKLFVGSRATYQTTDEISRMQENIRFAFELMSRTVHQAAYRSSPNSFANQVFTGGTIALTGTDGGGTTADSFTVRYQGSGNGIGTADGSVVDCLGREIDAGVMSTNTFTIAAGANGANALFCNTGAVGGAVEVASDVDNMQVLYGEDTNADLVADRYVPAGNVSNFDNVVAVRLALLFRTTNVGASMMTDTSTYDLNGTSVGPFNDTRIRRIVTMNINMRNRTP